MGFPTSSKKTDRRKPNPTVEKCQPPISLSLSKMATASVTPLSSVFSTSKPSSSIPKPHPSSTVTFKTDEQEYSRNQQSVPSNWNAVGNSRREFVRGMGLVPLLVAVPPPPHSEAREVEVGAFLPPLPSDPSFVVFKASPKDTPALRAGNTCVLNSTFFSIRLLLSALIGRWLVKF